MRAAYFRETGPADVLHYGDLPDPTPEPLEVLVSVEAVAVDPVDTFVRSGRWATSLTRPAVVGRDLVGTVAAVGQGVVGFRPGERVWTNSAGYDGRPGATAELVPVAQERLYRLPSDADPVAFVGTVHPGATAHGVLIGRARLQPAQTLLVVGANGAVGMCLVQVGAALGATVVAVVRDPASVPRLRELGADRVIVADDPVAAVAHSLPDGVDVVVDTTGHLDTAAMVSHLRPRGRLVLVSGRGRADLDLWAFETRELEIIGFLMSKMTVPELAAAADWLNDPPKGRRLVVDIGAVLGFQDTRHAHELLESSKLPRTPHGTVGRIILTP